ncbi:MAG: DUF1501 domain-containing protein [Gemmataceae bacterium]|nr:DUF1501 domain-containing protein [Gemmataceae bacterium]
MLTITGSRQSYCDGIGRRSFLKVGAMGAAGMALPEILRHRAEAGSTKPASPRGVIIVCLTGGPSHLDMYDMKPDAPEECRGQFKPIQTNVPGLDICEHMPLQAKIADKLALVRNMSWTLNDHKLHELYTGFAGDVKAPFLSPPVRPAFGSVVSKIRSGTKHLLPQYVSMGPSDFYHIPASDTPLYLGSAHAPFEPKGQGLANMELKAGMTRDRLDERRGLLGSFDQMRRELDARGQMESVDQYTAKALDMMTSPAVRDAFDIEKEAPKVRELYGPDVKFKWEYQAGHTWHASRFLMARRLVEAGVPVVTLAEGGWDDHGKVNNASPQGTLFERMKEKLPVYDRSIYALISDIHQRGLQNDIAVLVWGEFGRTPRVNFAGGRDHWTRAGFSLFAGGGFHTGQVIGKTDERGQVPVNKAYTPQNVFASLYNVLGIDPDNETYSHPSGRPMHLLDDTNRITELG